jgi:hypothetical protein
MAHVSPAVIAAIVTPHAPPEPPEALASVYAVSEDHYGEKIPGKRKQKMCEDCHQKCASYGSTEDNRRRWCVSGTITAWAVHWACRSRWGTSTELPCLPGLALGPCGARVQM